MEALRKGRNALRGYVPIRRSSVSQQRTHVSWDGDSPRLLVTADAEDFDPTIIQHFKDEGFDVAYLPQYGAAGVKFSAEQLHRLEEPLEDGDRYAIVGKTGYFIRSQQVSRSQLTIPYGQRMAKQRRLSWKPA